jgi:hypothetical protein
MRQDWVTEFLQDLPSLSWALFVIMPSFELALTVLERSLLRNLSPFLTQWLHACLYREDVKFPYPMGPDPDGSGPFWPTSQRIGPKHPKNNAMESLISGPGYNSQ